MYNAITPESQSYTEDCTAAIQIPPVKSQTAAVFVAADGALPCLPE